MDFPEPGRPHKTNNLSWLGLVSVIDAGFEMGGGCFALATDMVRREWEGTNARVEFPSCRSKAPML